MSTSQPAPHLDDAAEGLSPTTSHPAYVAVAPDWFWDQGDGRAPFGSDDGHDTLRQLEEHYAASPPTSRAPAGSSRSPAGSAPRCGSGPSAR